MTCGLNAYYVYVSLFDRERERERERERDRGGGSDRERQREMVTCFFNHLIMLHIIVLANA